MRLMPAEFISALPTKAHLAACSVALLNFSATCGNERPAPLEVDQVAQLTEAAVKSQAAIYARNGWGEPPIGVDSIKALNTWTDGDQVRCAARVPVKVALGPFRRRPRDDLRGDGLPA